MTKISTLLLISIIFSFCDDPDCPKNLWYRLPYSLQPFGDNNNYRIGDTLWMEMRFPLKMKDVNGGIENEIPEFVTMLNPVIDIFRMDSIDNSNSANGNFEITAHRGEVIPQFLSGGLTTNVIFENQNDSLFFKAFLIPKEKGVFILGVYSPGDGLRIEHHLPICKRTEVYMSYKANHEEDSNGYEFVKFDINKVSKHEDLTKVQFDSLGCFAFRVY